MLKTHKKWLSMLVVATMLMTFVLPIGIASAETTYANYTSTYMYISADTDQGAGSAIVTEKVANTYTSDDVYVSFTLPAGVKFHTKPANLTGVTAPAGASLADSSDSMLEVKFTPTVNTTDTVVVNFSDAALRLDVDPTVTGDLKASIELLGIAGGAVNMTESGTVTIAKVANQSVTVTAADAKMVSTGVAKDGADITVQEAAPGSLKAGEFVTFEIETPDVTFNATPTATYTQVAGDAATINPAGTIAQAKVTTASTALKGKVVLSGIKLNIPPTVSDDIKIAVYSSDSDSKVARTTVTVAKFGTGSGIVKNVLKGTDTVYISKGAALSATFDMEASAGSTFDTDKTVIFELSNGKWDTADWVVGTDYFTGTLTFRGYYNSDKTAWFTVKGTPTKISVTSLDVKAPADASTVGDIVVNVSGTAGITGSATVGKIAAPISVTADKPSVKAESASSAAGDITITEAGKAAVTATEDIVLTLPTGITFDGVPTVKVTAGTMVLAATPAELIEGNSTLTIDVTTASNIASTIKISGIKYNVNKLASSGDASVTVKVGANKITSVANAKIVSATASTVVFVIGESKYTSDGTSTDMDVASYIKNDRTYVPVRYAASALGVSDNNIIWDGVNKTATLIKGDRVVQMTIGSKIMILNGVQIAMDTAPELVNGRTMLPIGFVAKAFGATATWDDATKTATIATE